MAKASLHIKHAGNGRPAVTSQQATWKAHPGPDSEASIEIDNVVGLILVLGVFDLVHGRVLWRVPNVEGMI